MSDQHLLAEPLSVAGSDHVSRNAGQIAIVSNDLPSSAAKVQVPAGAREFQTKLPRQIVAEGGRADLGDRETAGCHDQRWRPKFDIVGLTEKNSEVRATSVNLCVQENVARAHVGIPLRASLRHLSRRAVAEQLSQGLLVIWNVVFVDERNEIRRSVAGERGFGEVRICTRGSFRAGSGGW